MSRSLRLLPFRPFAQLELPPLGRIGVERRAEVVERDVEQGGDREGSREKDAGVSGD